MRVATDLLDNDPLLVDPLLVAVAFCNVLYFTRLDDDMESAYA
jgi:hypothetical protein